MTCWTCCSCQQVRWKVHTLVSKYQELQEQEKCVALLIADEMHIKDIYDKVTGALTKLASHHLETQWALAEVCETCTNKFMHVVFTHILRNPRAEVISQASQLDGCTMYSWLGGSLLHHNSLMCCLLAKMSQVQQQLVVKFKCILLHNKWFSGACFIYSTNTTRYAMLTWVQYVWIAIR